MNLTNVKLPSNKKFGFFFSLLFFIGCIYFYYVGIHLIFYIFGTLSITLFVITLIKSDLLLPLNKLWMRFGLLLGIIVSPIVLGIIFFGLFTPIAILMRLSGRDELRLKFSPKVSHWITRSKLIKSQSFKQQF